MKRKRSQYKMFKLSTERLIQYVGKSNKIKVIPLALTEREAIERCELVTIQCNQLTNQLEEYYKQNNLPSFGDKLYDIIVNVVVPEESKSRGEKEYATIAHKGFQLNGKKFVRLCSGSGQIRRNTVTFIREDLYKPITESLLCGLSFSDFGKDFNAAKFNAYFGLNMSGCDLLPIELFPKVCIVDDYEEIRPHNVVNHVTEREVKYIALADDDLIISDDNNEYEIDGKTAIRKSDGKTFAIHKGIKKEITQQHYDDIPDSPALNSFDGQGLMSPEWAERVSDYLNLGFTPSALTIRAPWVKGLLACVPFHEWFHENGITEIRDSFGGIRQIDDIDCIISKSQFKMLKIYKKKFEKKRINAWDYYCQQMQENHLLWGVVRINNIKDDDIKAMNYQYIQALNIDPASDGVKNLCQQTMDFLESLNSGDFESVYDHLMIKRDSFIADDEIEDEENEQRYYSKLYQLVIESNHDFINDKFIREKILRECKTKFDNAKLGKILVRGNFQFCISDPIAQMEWIAKNHCDAEMDVQGVVKAEQIYSKYWMECEDATGQIVLMRSPLIDRNEIAKRELIKDEEHYFRYLSSGLVYSIHDLTALQQGGCDFDGDLSFSTNDAVVLASCYDYETAKPLYYDLATTDLVGMIDKINVIQADKRGLNSAVGQISNKSGSLFAKMIQYEEGTKEYNKIFDSIIALGQVVGMEIDRIKTAVAPTEPLEWKPLQMMKKTNENKENINVSNEEEQAGVRRHNNLVPNSKPYYFRYNYDYIDTEIRRYNNNFGKVSKMKFGCKFDKWLDNCKDGTASDEEMELYGQYQKGYPALDTDCLMNNICHLFEKFEKELSKQTRSEGRNMLIDYVSGNGTDEELKKAKEIADGYRRFLRFIAKSLNSDTHKNRKSKGQKAHDNKKVASEFYRERIMDLSGGDIQLAFDLLMNVSGNDEKIVFGILDDYIIEIID